MELTLLKKYAGDLINLGLRNNFVYSRITFEITKDGNIKFIDKKGQEVIIEPEFVSMITKSNGGKDGR